MTAPEMPAENPEVVEGETIQDFRIVFKRRNFVYQSVSNETGLKDALRQLDCSIVGEIRNLQFGVLTKIWALISKNSLVDVIECAVSGGATAENLKFRLEIDGFPIKKISCREKKSQK